MQTDPSNLLRDIQEYHQKRSLTLRGLSSTQLKQLSTQVGLSLPHCMRQILMVTGLLTNPVGMMDRIELWVGARKWVTRAAGGARLVAFEDADDDYWAVDCADDECERVLFVPHGQPTVVDIERSLVDHLELNWEAWKQSTESWRRERSVQFIIPGEHAGALQTLVSAVGGKVIMGFGQRERKPLDMFMSVPEQPEPSRGGLPPEEAVILVRGHELRVQRSSYGPLEPHISITVTDPEDRIFGGLVDHFRTALKAASVAATEADYGIA